MSRVNLIQLDSEPGVYLSVSNERKTRLTILKYPQGASRIRRVDQTRPVTTRDVTHSICEL